MGESSVFSLWPTLGVFDPQPPRSIVPSSPLNLPLQLNEAGPLPLISVVFDLIASDVYEFTFDSPSPKRGASPGGCVFIGLALRAELPKRDVCNSRTKKIVAQLRLIPRRIERIWFSIDSYLKSGCLKLQRDSLSGGMKCYLFYLTSLLDSLETLPPGSSLIRNIFWL